MKKTKIKNALKTAVLYLSFCIIAGAILDTAIIKAILAVQFPHKPISCEMATSTPAIATSTPDKATTTKEAISPAKSGTIREVSAYNSLEAQTDATPCIGADGTDLCKRYQAGECIVASNAYKLGSKIDLQGFGICTVADRMNKRFQNRIDVFMDKDHERAVSFGVQKLLVSLVNSILPKFLIS